MLRSVPLSFNDPTYFAPIGKEHLCLNYTIAPAGFQQTRFKDKLVATPDIDLSEYEFRAVFDWIEIIVETKKVYAGKNLHSTLSRLNREHRGFGTCHVRGPNGRAFHAGRVHIVRMQDPAPGRLPALLRAFLLECCLAKASLADIAVIGIELSLDIYPAHRFCKGEQDYALRRMKMTELMRKHISIGEMFRGKRRHARFTHSLGEKASCTTRVVEASGPRLKTIRRAARNTGLPRTDIAALYPDRHHQPFVDSTFYFGNKNEQLHFRSMDKVSDRRRKEGSEPLDIWDTRSRLEFTLTEVELGRGKGPKRAGINSFEDLMCKDLAGSRKAFRFDLPTFDPQIGIADQPDPEAWKIFTRSGVYGLAYRNDVKTILAADTLSKRAKKRRTTSSSGSNQRYSAFNGRVTRAIRRLQDRFRDAEG